MTGIPQGLEFPVNTITAGSQQTFFPFSGFPSHTPRAVAIDSDGDYIVTWTGQDGGLTGIFARRYNSAGVAQDNPVTGDDLEFRVNATTAGRQAFSSVAMDADGDFVITWTSEQDDGLGTSYGIYAQRYDSAGAALGGEFLVNALSSTDQIESTIAIAANGDFIVTWTSPDSSNTGIFAKLYRYNATGNLIPSTAFPVNTTTANTQRASSVAMDADGDFVVTWTSNGQDGSFDGVYAQRYDKTGTAQGAEFRVNTTTVSNQQNASVSMDTAGNFVVAWSSENQDLDGFGVYAQIFNAAGDRVGGEFRVNQFTTSNQQSPSISVDADGDFVVTWSSNNQSPDSASTGIFSRRFNKSGIPQGNEFLVNTTFAGTQQYPSVAVDSNGDFVVAWTSPDGSGNGVYGQRFSPSPNNSPIELNLTSETVAENVPANTTVVGTFSTIDPDPGTTFIYSLIDPGSFPDNINFEIGGINGDQLILLVSPDREIKSSYTINVQTTQTTDPAGFPYSEILTITVTDVSDTAPTDITLTPISVAEDAAIGTPAGTVSTTDPDSSDTSFTYALVGTPADFPDNASFSINPNTGQLTVAAALDVDTRPTGIYSIRVSTTDPASRSYVKTLSVTVTNVNEAPTDLDLTPKDVDENVAIGTRVGDFSSTDPDAGDTFTYTFVDTATFPDNTAFTIDAATKQLKVNAALDFETKPSYSIRVRTTDAGNVLFFEETLTITVNNLVEAPPNQAPTDLDLTPKNVDENVAIGTRVGDFSSTDPNAGDTFTYTFVDTATFPDNTAFTIDAATKQLKVNAALDFETKPSYSIRVRTTDSGNVLFYEETLTVSVTNGNDAPTDLDLTPKAVDENVAVGTPVGLFSTTDPNAGDTFTYTLVDSATFPDNAAFIIDAATKELKVNAALDFETKPSYSIRVRTTDSGNVLFYEETLTVSVTNGNDAPTDLDLTPKAVDENVAVGTPVGLFSTTDPNAGDTFTYTLVDSATFPDNAAFIIDAATKELKVNAALDFETKPSYSIRVRTTDSGNVLFYEETLTVSVTNGNDAPTDLDLTPKAVDENVAVGTPVGLFSTTDPNAGDTFTYTLVDSATFPDNAAFIIDAATKELKVNAALDFETKPSYSIRVRTTDSGNVLFYEETLTVSVTNGNDAPTDLDLTPKAVDENVAVGTPVGLFSTTDPNAGDTFTYTLVDSATFPDNAAFIIDAATKELKVNAALDFETKPSYSIRVRTTDSGNVLFYEETLTVSVTNGNDAPTDLDLTPKAVDENVAVGTPVGLFSTTDPNAGDTFTYTLVDSATFPDNAAFIIDAATKELKVNAALDFETKPSYSIRVRTTDSGNVLFYEETLTVSVTNGNDAPTDLDLTPKAVDENVAVGTPVGLFSTTDPNAGDTFTYTLVDSATFPDNAAFIIDAATKELKVNAALDFETKPSYSIRVRTTDSGNVLFYEETLTITVRDLVETPPNTAPTDLDLTPKAVDENVAVGTPVGLFSTTDPNAGDTFTYTLVDSATFPDNAAFIIDAATKELKVNAALDFETKPSYSIRVRTTDSGNVLFYEETLTITVRDLVETPPNTAPTDLDLTPKAVDENVAVGTPVGLFSTTDPNAGDTFTYTLVDSATFPDNAAFIIDAATKELKVNAALDFETKPSYSIRVRTTDSGNVLFYEETLTITVRDLVETPPNTAPTDLDLTPKAVDENVAVGTPVGLFSTTDPNAGDTFTYTLVDSATFPDNAAFIIDAATKELKVNAALDFETKPSYSIRVRTTDSGNVLFYEETLTITVRDLVETPANTAPTDLDLTPKAVDENVAVGTPVGLFSTTDPNAGDTFTYTLVDSATFPDNAAFIIDAATKELKVNAALDFETKPSYSIRVRTTDSGNVLFYEETLTITVRDLVETPPNTAPTDLDLTPKAVDENVAVGTPVGLFSTTDPNAGDTFTYTLVDSATFPDNAAFIIDAATKELKVNAALDFETKPSYSIRVRTTDAGGLFVEETLTVTVNNLVETPANTAPTDLDLTPKAVDENVAPGTVVGLFSSTDPNAGDTFTYTLVDPVGFPDNAAFTIDPATKQLKVNAPLDFETKPTYSIRVRTTDAGGLFVEETLTVTVNNLVETPANTAPTDLDLTPKAVDENVATGTVVGLFSTTDPNAGDTFTYTLVDPVGFPDNAAFTIDPATKQLKVNAPLDFETKPTYSIRVRTTDAGGLFVEETLTVTVNNLVETPANTAPTDLDLTPKAVDENVATGTVVGLFSTTDPNAGDTFTYTFVGDPALFPGNTAFTIDAATKQLKVSAPLDFETKPSYSTRIRTTDAGGLFFEETLTIAVNNLVEAPPNQRPTDLVLTNNSVQENVLANTVIGSFTTADPDINDTFTYSLVSSATVPDNAAFTIDGGLLRIAVSPDFETKRNYSIRVRTTDQSGGFFEKNLAIAVADVDESNPGNGAPVLDLNGTAAGINGSAAAATGGAIQLVGAGATLTDADSPSLNSALVIISNSFDAPNETLTANTSGTNITATYSTTGVLNLTGIASLATYLQVLRSVTYTNSAPIPNTIPRNVLFIVSDGRNNSQVATTTLTLDSRNLVTGSDRNDLSLVTTPVTDVIDAEAGNDVVTSIAAYLKQQDSINGGDGVDTLVLQDGTGNLTVRVADTTNQLPDISAGTTVSNFEQFDLRGFTGNVDILGSATLDDNLTTGSGNDTLNGAGGNDVLAGNQGNDLYIVDSVGDRITEALNAGTDTVQSSINYALSADLENLTLTANAVNGTGNTLNNVLTGNAGANTLKGGAGNDTLLGGGKSDKLVGGAGDDVLDGQRGKKDRLKGGQGNDSFVLSTARGFGPDEILGFKPANDTILFSRSSAGVSIDLGAIAASQFVYGSAAQDSGDRFLYNRQSGALLFDSDGTGSARALLIATFKNKPTLTAADIVAI